MATTHNSIIINGSIGKELVFRQWAGKTIVSKAPGRRKVNGDNVITVACLLNNRF